LSSSLAPRPKYHACHGSTVDMQGTPAASHASETGLTTSGVDDASIRSTVLALMSSLATWAARSGLDWLSLGMIWIVYFLLSPAVTPSFTASRTRPRM
jgi:hypothetical protein